MHNESPLIIKNLVSREYDDEGSPGFLSNDFLIMDEVTGEKFDWGYDEHVFEETIEHDGEGFIRNVFRIMAFSNLLRSHEYNFGFIKIKY